MLERTFSGRLLDASACPSQWDSGGSCGRRRQCPPWRLTLHEGAGNERVSGHRTGLLCVQKAEEREWTGAVAQAGPRACKGPGACCSMNHQAEGGGSGAEWEGEEPFGGCGGFSFSPESGEPWEGVELGIGEVASGVHRSLLAAAGAAGGGPGRRSRQGEGAGPGQPQWGWEDGEGPPAQGGGRKTPGLGPAPGWRGGESWFPASGLQPGPTGT